MVTTRRRSLAVQVSPNPSREAGVKKPPIKKETKKKAGTSQSSSPTAHPDQDREPGQPIQDSAADDSGKRILRRRSSTAIKVPAQKKKQRLESETPLASGKKVMQPLRTSDDENFKEETGTNAAGESVETAHPVTTERASSNKENEVEDNDFVDNVRKIETASRSAPRKKKVKSKELSGSDEKDSPKDEMCDVVSNHDVAEQDLKPKSSTGRDVSRTATKRKRSEKAHSDAPMSDGEGGLSTADVDSDDSDFSPSHRSKQSKKRSTNESGDGKQIRKKCSKSERSVSSEATPETEPASSSKPGLEPRQESNEPIVRPDIFALPSVRNEIAALPKDLSPAEAIEEKFRIYAAAVAIGRNLEISLEEANQAIRELKMLCESRSAAPVTVQNSEEMDEYASSSEDEWEEMELVEVGEGKKKDVEVTVEGSDERNFESLWLRREVNRCVRENWENCHRVNILCYIAHLQHLRKDVLEHNLVSALMLSTIPPECENVFGRMMSVEIASKVVEHYKSTFKASDKSDGQYTIEEMVSLKVYNNDADRAVLLFGLFLSLGCTTRICVNTQPIPRKWDEGVLESIAKMKDSSSPSIVAEANQKGKGATKKKNSSGADHQRMTRNYWVEFWDKKQKRWICVDPLRAAVDEPNAIEENATKPIVYVLAVDNEGGVRDVTARYAADYSRPDFRRRRTDPDWIDRTLRKKMIRADRKRARLEDNHFKRELVKKPLPTTLSEYKNHPLYVLEKDLLKFEAIYPRPEDQTPLGEVRGHKVYPRSCVHTLQGANNWIKQARSVKEGEKPYKVVKARPNIRVPAEEREQRYLDVYGYWQTEPYRPPKVKDGQIPCNEFGNVYMFQPSMCPIGAVHLRLSGLPSIARRLGGLPCVPAVVGFDFSGGGSFPVIDGAVVLKEDANKFVKEWERLEATREERENKRREERVLGNWRKLIRGILRLHYVRTKFGAVKEKTKGKKKKEAKEEDEKVNRAVIDKTVLAQGQVFTHDDLMQQKS
ncbi:hypothetical protein V3C99_009140 [Haemonchus contortus]